MFVCVANLLLKKQAKVLCIFLIILLQNFNVIKSRPLDKRTLVSNAQDINGQVEQLFDGNNQIDTNYDEYPMVVPKRAALMLDRLMVALHRALEKERAENNRIHELLNTNSIEDKINANAEQEPHNYNMYSDDDPTVLDYDFKDLNAVNRATGETLLTNSFQRRANIIEDRVDAFKNSALSTLTTQGDQTNTANISGRRGNIPGKNVVWRCFFNAISCF